MSHEKFDEHHFLNPQQFEGRKHLFMKTCYVTFDLMIFLLVRESMTLI